MSRGKKKRKAPNERPVDEVVAAAPPPPSGRKQQLLVLTIFGLGFVVLLTGYLVFKPDDPSVPSAVAIVKVAPGRTVSIIDTEFKQAVEQKSDKPLGAVPRLGNKQLEDIQAAVLFDLLEELWYREEAQALKVSVTNGEVADKLAQTKAKKYPSEAAYRKYLKDSNLTPQDFERLIRNQLLRQKVKEQGATWLSPEKITTPLNSCSTPNSQGSGRRKQSAPRRF